MNGADDSTGRSAPLNRRQHHCNNLSCMLSHENLERHTKFHHLQDQTPNFPDELHITIAQGVPGTSRSISPDSSHELETPDADLLDHIPFTNTIVTDSERSHHVHFRPRVRISSGFSRHRYQHVPSRQDDLLSISPDSSLSSSLSSSISVPLRSRSDDEADKPGWGPLGQRVSLLAHRPRGRTSKRRRSKQNDTRLNANEHTPLMHSPPPTVYVEGEVVYEEESEMDESDRERTRSSREADTMFGTWPGRLVNLHVRLLTYNLTIFVDNDIHKWWWWQLTSVVHCRCLDDTE